MAIFLDHIRSVLCFHNDFDDTAYLLGLFGVDKLGTYGQIPHNVSAAICSGSHAVLHKYHIESQVDVLSWGSGEGMGIERA